MTIKKSITYNLIGQVITAIVGFILSIATARYLGPQVRGDAAIFSNSLSLVVLWLGFGFSNSIVHFIASNKASASQAYKTNILIIFITTILLFLGLKILSYLNQNWLIFPSSYGSNKWQIVFIFLYFLTQYNNLCSAILSAHKNFKSIFFITIITNLFSVFFWGIVFIQKDKIDNKFGIVLLLSICLALLSSLYFTYLLVKKRLIEKNDEFLSKSILKSIASFAFIVYLANAIQFFTYRMDLWIVKYFHLSAETGIYSLAVNLAQYIWLLPSTLSSVFYAFSADVNNDISVQVAQSSRLVFTVSVIFGLCGLLLSWLFLIPLYGKEFSNAIIYIAVLLIGIIPFSVTTVIGSYIAGINKPELNLYAAIYGFIICTVADFLLIKPLGGLGASIATSISYLLITIYLAFKFARLKKIKFSHLFLITKKDVEIFKMYFKKSKKNAVV